MLMTYVLSMKDFLSAYFSMHSHCYRRKTIWYDAHTEVEYIIALNIQLQSAVFAKQNLKQYLKSRS